MKRDDQLVASIASHQAKLTTLRDYLASERYPAELAEERDNQRLLQYREEEAEAQAIVVDRSEFAQERRYVTGKRIEAVEGQFVGCEIENTSGRTNCQRQINLAYVLFPSRYASHMAWVILNDEVGGRVACVRTSSIYSLPEDWQAK